VYDLFGTDYHLIKNDAYPIRQYSYWEETQTEKRLDPMAAITEVMSKLKEGEMIWTQLLVRPTDTSWQDKSMEERDKLIGRKKSPPPKGFAADVAQFGRNLFAAPFQHPVWPEEEKKREETRLLMMTKGEQEVVKGIEEKASKLGFETALRFIFVDKKESFSPLNISATMSVFNQFHATNMNGFRPNLNTMTLAVGFKSNIVRVIATSIKFIKKRIVWYRKRMLWDSFQKVLWPRKRSILNTEELATIYHFPSLVVEAPLLRRVPSKKGEPPAGLPIG